MKVIKEWTRQFCVFLISLYQQHLSPVKGFSCAHRTLHNGESCSQFVKRSLLENDLLAAVRLSEQRFAECGAAARELATQEVNDASSLKTDAVELQKSSRLHGRRSFLRIFLPAFFILGFASPAFARGRLGRGGSCSCCSGASDEQSTSKKDSKSENPSNPLSWALCCCGGVGIMKAGQTGSKNQAKNND